MKITRILMVLATAFAVSGSCLAEQGRETGNGGDTSALEFKISAMEAVRDLVTSISDYPELAGHDLARIAYGVAVVIVEKSLFVTHGASTQESTAVNYRDQNKIEVNRARWKALENVDLRKAIALHEILSLAGIEETGSYPVSIRYLQARGFECPKDEIEKCVWAPIPGNGHYGSSAVVCGKRVLGIDPSTNLLVMESTTNPTYRPILQCRNSGTLVYYKRSASLLTRWNCFDINKKKETKGCSIDVLNSSAFLGKGFRDYPDGVAFRRVHR